MSVKFFKYFVGAPKESANKNGSISAKLAYFHEMLIGNKDDTGGTTTDGTISAKLNAIISNTAANNTASTTGTLSQKSTAIYNLLNSTNTLVNTINNKVPSKYTATTTTISATTSGTSISVASGRRIVGIAGKTSSAFGATIYLKNSNMSTSNFASLAYKVENGSSNGSGFYWDVSMYGDSQRITVQSNAGTSSWEITYYTVAG